MPLSWTRALLSATATAIGWAALGAPAALPLALAIALPYESVGLGDPVWSDSLPRHVIGGGALVWGGVGGALALIAHCLSGQQAVRVADHCASEIRPPADERAELARSWVITWHTTMWVAQWFVGILLFCAVVVVVMDPDDFAFGATAALGVLFCCDLLLMRLCTRVLQPRWAARWDDIRSRWPRTSSQRRVVTVPRAPLVSVRLLTVVGTLTATGVLSGLIAVALLLRGGGPGEHAEFVTGPPARLAAGHDLGVVSGVLLALAVLGFVCSVIIEDLGRIAAARRCRRGLPDSVEDAARELVGSTPGEGIGAILLVFAGLFLTVALGADDPLAMTPPEDAVDLTVMRWMYVPAAVLGLLGIGILTLFGHARAVLRRDLLAAFPTVDPVRAVTRIRGQRKRADTFVPADDEDRVDHGASMKLSRDEARGIYDD